MRELRGARLWMTRPAGRGAEWNERFRELGAEVVHRPAIAFGPPTDPGAVARAIATVDRFDHVVVTSPTGAERLAEALAHAGGSLAALRGRIAVVGAGTGRAVSRLGGVPAVVADRADADGLAASLTPRVAPGDRVLVVRPERARDAWYELLRRAGAEIVPVVFYRTVVGPGCAEATRELLAGRFDAVVFSSPSTFDAVAGHPAVPERLEALRSVATVAIGPITAESMRREGVVPTRTAPRPVVDDVVEAVALALADRNGPADGAAPE